MSHKNKVSLVDQVKLALDEKLAIGQSKYLDKSLNQTSDKIYSWETPTGADIHSYRADYANRRSCCSKMVQH